MLFGSGTSKEYIINVDIHRRYTMEDLIHEVLKCLGCILKSEWHPDKIEQSERSGDSSSGNFFRDYRDLVVGSDEIKLGENGSTM